MTEVLAEQTQQVVNSAELLAAPSLGSRRLDVAAGTALHESDARASDLYFIHCGQVRVYQVGRDGSARLLEILGPGDWFGVAALAQVPTYGSRAVAMCTASISQVAAERWLEFIAGEPEMTARFIGQLAGKLQAAHEDAACLVFDDCNHRLVRTLLHFSRSAAATPSDDGVVLHITHQQLAQAVGAARETVSLALTHLRHQKLLRTGRNQLFFNPKTLQEFTERANTASPAAPPAGRERVA